MARRVLACEHRRRPTRGTPVLDSGAPPRWVCGETASLRTAIIRNHFVGRTFIGRRSRRVSREDNTTYRGVLEGKRVCWWTIRSSRHLMLKISTMMRARRAIRCTFSHLRSAHDSACHYGSACRRARADRGQPHRDDIRRAIEPTLGTCLESCAGRASSAADLGRAASLRLSVPVTEEGGCAALAVRSSNTTGPWGGGWGCVKRRLSLPSAEGRGESGAPPPPVSHGVCRVALISFCASSACGVRGSVCLGRGRRARHDVCDTVPHWRWSDPVYAFELGHGATEPARRGGGLATLRLAACCREPRSCCRFGRG